MRSWRLWIGLVISLLCLALALTGIDWSAVGTTLRQAEWRFFVPAGAMLLAFLVARSYRWRVLLGSQVALADAFAATNIGYLVSNVLPFRLGDPARAAVVGLGGKVKVSAALSTVVIERVLDLLAVVALLAATGPYVTQVGWTRQAGVAAGSIALAVFVLLLILATRPDWALITLETGLMRVPGVNRERWLSVGSGLLEGLASLRSGSAIAGLVALSAITWLCSVGCYLALLRAFVPRASVAQAAFLTSAIGLGMALPSAPGATGVFHSVARYALEIPFGLSSETAVTVAFASHAFMYVTMSALGLVGLAQQGLSWRALRSRVTASPAGE